MVEKTLELTQPTELSEKTVSKADVPLHPLQGSAGGLRVVAWPLNSASQQVVGQHPPPPGLAGGSRHTRRP